MLKTEFEIGYKRFSIHSNFSVLASEIVGLFGPSGSGKTSVLMALAGFVNLKNGNIHFNNSPWNFRSETLVSPQNRKIGLMLQNSVLFPNLNVEQNIKLNIREVGFEYDFLVTQLGLENILKSKPQELSGGQIQRVALARILHRKNQLLLLDEPVSALDENNVEVVSELLKEYRYKFRVPIFIVSHNKNFLSSCCDRSLVITLDEKNKTSFIKE